jgi:hypothetical protein
MKLYKSSNPVPIPSVEKRPPVLCSRNKQIDNNNFFSTQSAIHLESDLSFLLTNFQQVFRNDNVLHEL